MTKDLNIKNNSIEQLQQFQTKKSENTEDYEGNEKISLFDDALNEEVTFYDFDKQTITPEQVELIKEFLNDPDKFELNFLKSPKDNTYTEKLTSKTIEDYEKEFEEKYPDCIPDGGIWKKIGEKPENPDTPEFKQHDAEMEKIEEEYERTHPKPDIDPYAMYLFPDWEFGKKEYMAKQEENYRAEHPEYAKQAVALDNLRREYHMKHMTDV